MTIRPILTAPDPRLKAVSTDVEKVDGEIRKLVDDMAESMYEADGIGLAAVQIGVPKRVIVMDLDQKEGKKNPRAYHQSEDPLGVGGNGDVRGRLPLGARNLGRCRTPGAHQVPNISTATAQRSCSKPTACSRPACSMRWIISKGVLFIDHLSQLKRSIALRKLQKAKRLKETG